MLWLVDHALYMCEHHGECRTTGQMHVYFGPLDVLFGEMSDAFDGKDNVLSALDWTEKRIEEPVNCAKSDELGIDYTHVDDVYTAYQFYLNHKWSLQKKPPTWHIKGGPIDPPKWYMPNFAAVVEE